MEVLIKYEQTREFLDSLSREARARSVRSMVLLGTVGHHLRMPHVKQIDRGLFELRIHGRQEVRFFFTFREPKIYILHGFVKKSMRIPNHELFVAKKRMSMLDVI